MRSESIPLTVVELRAIGSIRTSKQRSKRLLLVLIPAILMFIAGIAFYKGKGWDIGSLLMVVAAAGALAGTLVVARWSNGVIAQFAGEHQGAFWKKEKDETK